MGWIKDDEFLILMDMEDIGGSVSGPCVPPDLLPSLRDAGIQTAVKYLYWNRVEPMRGYYDWSEPDSYVEKNRKAGLKTLLNTYVMPVSWGPGAWYTRYEDSLQPGSLSLWNEEAQEYSNGFIKICCDRYNSDDVLCFNGQMSVGETVFHNQPAWYDPSAIAAYKRWAGASAPMEKGNPTTEAWLKQSYIETLLKQQVIFAETEHKEIWTAVNRVIASYAGLYGNGCGWTDDYFSSWKEQIPGCVINLIQYTYHPHGDGYLAQMREAIMRHGLKVWGGAEYCEGLVHSVPAAIRTNARGLIISPMHSFTGYKTIEPWMLDAIRKATDRLKKNYRL